MLTGIAPAECGTAEGDGFIVLLESDMFLGECIRCGMESALSLPVVTYSTLSELEQQQLRGASAQLVVLLLNNGSVESVDTCTGALNLLSQVVPGIPVVVLGFTNKGDVARIAMRHGAKGYIPCTTDFDIAVQAVRFILAGGTYVPVDCFLQTGSSLPATSDPPPAPGVMTSREIAVVRAIGHGKSNKVIAYELNLSQGMVKVHVSNVMKKLRAKNRTDVAIKAQRILNTTNQTDSNIAQS